MFGQTTRKNRRMTPKEYAEDLEDSKIWGRYPKTFIYDTPFYKDLIPEPIVNFSLNYHF